MHSKIKISNTFFYTLGLFFMCSTEAVFSANTETIFGISKESIDAVFAYAELVLLMIQIVVIQKYTKKELVLIAGLAIPVLISTVVSGQNTFLASILVIIAGKNSDMDHIIKLIYRATLTIVVMIIALGLTGVIESKLTYRASLGIKRTSLGFVHANTLGEHVFVLLAYRTYLRFKNLTRWDYLLCIGTAAFCYLVPNCQTAVFGKVEEEQKGTKK